MKTLEELYREVMADDALKSEYVEAAGGGRAEDFIKAHGCDATAAELEEFMEKDCESDITLGGVSHGELSDDELDDVAAGRKCGTVYKDGRPVVSVGNGCDHFRCGKCNKPDAYGIRELNSCRFCYASFCCIHCRFCKYKGGLWLCFNPKRLNN